MVITGNSAAVRGFVRLVCEYIDYTANFDIVY